MENKYIKFCYSELSDLSQAKELRRFLLVYDVPCLTSSKYYFY